MTRYLTIAASAIAVALLAYGVDIGARNAEPAVMALAGEPPAAESPLVDLPKQISAESARGSTLQIEPPVPAKIEAAGLAADDVRPATVPGGLLLPSN